MPVFKFVISSKEKSYQVEKDQKDSPVLGKKIGESIPGDFLGLEGYMLKITGGSDKDGFPMRNDIEGTMRRRILITKGTGFAGTKKKKKGYFKVEGVRRRKMLRGDSIAADIIQINCRVEKAGEKPIEELLGKKGEAATPEIEEKKGKPKEEAEAGKKEAPEPEAGAEAAAKESKPAPSDTKEIKSETKEKSSDATDTEAEKK